MAGIIVDIGTGDGSFAYELAKQNPDRLIIGIDPNHKNLEKLSLAASRKPAKGGLQNVMFVLASVEDLPHELDGLVNQVFINFPWRGLLKSILLVEPGAWNNIKRICQPGALVDVLFGVDDQIEAGERDKLALPSVTLPYISEVMAPKLIQGGLRPLNIKIVDGKSLTQYPSSWAKKLSFGKPRQFYYLRLQLQ